MYYTFFAVLASTLFFSMLIEWNWYDILFPAPLKREDRKWHYAVLFLLKKKEKEKLNWFVIDFVPSVGWGLDDMTSWFPSNLNQSKSYDNGIFIK